MTEGLLHLNIFIIRVRIAVVVWMLHWREESHVLNAKTENSELNLD